MIFVGGTVFSEDFLIVLQQYVLGDFWEPFGRQWGSKWVLKVMCFFQVDFLIDFLIWWADGVEGSAAGAAPP